MDSQLSYFLRLSSIIEAMPDALVIVDNNGRIVLINGQTEHLFGYERSELLGEYVEQLMPERYRGKHTKHRDHYFVMPRVRSMGVELELFGMQKNGTEFPIEISLSPLKTEEGTFALAAVRDISIRKKAEEKFKSILEATPDCLIVINNVGTIILVNNRAEKLFGHATNEIVGQHVEFLIPKRFHGNHVGHRNNYFADPRVRPMGAGLELYGQHKKGHEFPVEISLSPLETEEGLLALAAVRDITKQKLLEEQLRTKNTELEQQNRFVQEANRLKSEFLANMSHELRTPLNGIIGFSEIMIDDEIDPVSEEHREFLNDILTSSEHLLRLINDMLDLAKIEAGKMEFYFEKVDLNKIINEVRDILRMVMAKKKINLEIEIDPELSQLIIDPAKFKQILYNYISNAIKFSPENGLITIKVYPEDKNNFRLDVTDSGIGISPENQNHLFVAFQQLDSSVAKKYQGTGLGLALTRRIVEAQGGKVGVMSEPNKGSTFYVILPTTKKLPKKTGSATLLPNTNKPIILVVEDNPIDRKIIVDTLMNAGFNVDTAVNGNEAIELGRRQHYDAITLDLILPDMSGWEVLKLLHTTGPNQNVPVIMTTIVAEKEASFGFRIHDYLVKPIIPNDLIKSIDQAKITAQKSNYILIIDDDQNSLKIAKQTLLKLGYHATCSDNAKEGLLEAKRKLPALIILDLLMPGMDGFEFLHHLRQLKGAEHIPVIVWTQKDLSEENTAHLQTITQAIVIKGIESRTSLLTELKRHLQLDDKK